MDVPIEYRIGAVFTLSSHKYLTLICLFFVLIQAGCGGSSSNTGETLDVPGGVTDNGDSAFLPQPDDTSEALTGTEQIPMAALPGNPGLRTSVLDGNAITSNTTYKFDLPAGHAISYSFSKMATVPVGDLTGDGIDDLAFTSGSYTSLARQSLILPGRTGGWPELLQPDHNLDLPRDTISLPYSFSNSIGDINNDGRDDLVILAEQYQAGDFRTFVSLDATGIGGDANSLSVDGTTAVQIEHPGRIIHYIEGIGDSNGDGIDDFIVYSGFTRSTTGQPQAFLVLGRQSGFPGVLNLVEPQPGVVPITITANTTGYAEVHAVGDVNGDGLTDFLFAYGLTGNDETGFDHFDSPWFTYGTGSYFVSSYANIIVTGREWHDSSAIVLSNQPISEAGMFAFESGRVLVPLGDITGDSLSDLFVDWGDSLTTLQIIAGNPDYASLQNDSDLDTVELSWQPPRSITDKFYGETPIARGGVRSNRRSTEIKAAGDLDGDGIADIVVYQSTSGDYYHWPLGQYYVLYGKHEINENIRPKDSATLVTQANGPPVAVGDVDNDGIGDLGITQAAYILEQNADSLKILTDTETPELTLSIPPYADGYSGGHFFHPTGPIIAQVLSSPGLQENTVPDTWTIDLNESNTVVDSDLLTQLVDLLEATERLNPETNNPLNWQVDEYSKLPDNTLSSISVQHSSGSIQTSLSNPPIRSEITIENSRVMSVKVTHGFYSARDFWTHERNCEIDLTNNQIMRYHNECRDAVTVAIERLSQWQ